jgi:hypothetical protein
MWQRRVFADGLIKTGAFVLVVTLSGSGWASDLPPGFESYGGPPIVKDERSAIRIARALMLARWPTGPWADDEAKWARNCQATLHSGVWLVRNRGPAGVAGRCTGPMVVGVGEKDGGWRGYAYF